MFPGARRSRGSSGRPPQAPHGIVDGALPGIVLLEQRAGDPQLETSRTLRGQLLGGLVGVLMRSEGHRGPVPRCPGADGAGVVVGGPLDLCMGHATATVDRALESHMSKRSSRRHLLDVLPFHRLAMWLTAVLALACVAGYSRACAWGRRRHRVHLVGCPSKDVSCRRGIHGHWSSRLSVHAQATSFCAGGVPAKCGGSGR